MRAFLDARPNCGAPLRLGVIGGGEAATKAISALRAVPWLDIVWVACRKNELEGLITCSQRIEDWLTVIGDNRVEAVYVATPNATHVPIAIEVLEKGKHVLIEKPLGLSVEDVRPLTKWAHSPLIIATALKKRYGDAIGRIRELHDEWGPPCHVNFEWRLPSIPIGWRCQRRVSGGGVVMDLGSHVLDLFEHLLGPARWLRAWAGERAGDCERTATIHVGISAGLVATSSLSWGSDVPHQSLTLRFGARDVTYARVSAALDTITQHHSFGEECTAFDAYSDYVGMFREYHRRVRTGTGNIVDLNAGARNLLLIELAYRSIAEGKTIEVATSASCDF